MRNCSQRVSFVIAGMCAISVAHAGKKQENKGFETKTISKTLKAETLYRLSRSVRAGQIVKAQSGVDGKLVRTYRLIKKGGKVVGKELIKEVKTDPTPTVFHMGKSGFETSRSGFVRSKTLVMKASAYDPGVRSNGRWAGRTSLGIRAKFGVVAVDPRVIPLGTLLFVEGYGMAYAADTGSAIKGNRIDLCMPTVAQCLQFGRRKVTVHVLKPR